MTVKAEMAKSEKSERWPKAKCQLKYHSEKLSNPF